MVVKCAGVTNLFSVRCFMVLCAVGVVAITLVGLTFLQFHSATRPEASQLQETTLVVSHVLFRHGNRTPELKELYPKDPYLNERYYPYGLGQLTKAGKQKEFNIGSALRSRYRNFLGDFYLPDMVESLSTDYNRTKMSLELVLASLFTPNKDQMFENGLYWQPVPYNYLPKYRDPILLGVLCPHFLELYDEAAYSAEVQTEINKHGEVVQYIAQNTGLNITKFEDIYNLFFGLATEEEWGFTLPPWTRKVWPKTMESLAVHEYYVALKTVEMRQMAVGYFLEKVIKDTVKKISGTTPAKKLFLYSAHENNLAELLIALGVFEYPHVPTYGSFILLEVHNITGVHGMKIFYENYSGQGVKLLKMPNCDEFCPLEQFVKLVTDLIPDRSLCGI
nr:unnamed protein product [Callosobruchus analis]